jgi:hypothetical protein
MVVAIGNVMALIQMAASNEHSVHSI